MAYHDQSAADENGMRPSLRGQLLVLNFEYNDIKHLGEDVEKVISAFEERGVKHHRVGIPMKDSSNTLEERLREFLPFEHSDELLVVYYNGHGGLWKGDGLVLGSGTIVYSSSDESDPGEPDPGEPDPDEFDSDQSTWLQKFVKRQ
ncbi:hypothetical protein SLS60_011901 [Paraconiothyrium brasiliense]|uniref:Caspase family p20 domain-containing protein n=1 Tax=Paraconiothyrium brasiliense TaxID=300254 RepID=A0ABR3QHY3_9PLEO